MSTKTFLLFLFTACSFTPCSKSLDFFIKTSGNTAEHVRIEIPLDEVNTITMAQLKTRYAKEKRIENLDSFDFSVIGKTFITDEDYAKNLYNANVFKGEGSDRNVIFSCQTYRVTVKTLDGQTYPLRTIEKKTTIRKLKKLGARVLNIDSSEIECFILKPKNSTSDIIHKADDDALELNLSDCEIDPQMVSPPVEKPPIEEKTQKTI